MLEADLLKQSTSLYKQGKINEAISVIDMAIESYNRKNDKLNIFPAYKKKCSYLYRNNRGDESWSILNKLSLTFAKDYITSAKIEDEKRKQLEFEKKSPIDTLDAVVRARIFWDRSKLIQNAIYKDNTFIVDFGWNEDEKILKLAEKSNVNWSKLKTFLILAYIELKHKNTKKEIILKTQDAYSYFREMLKDEMH